MKIHTLRSNLLLLMTAAIWGFAFVAQRVGVKYVGSFTFNGVRFALGTLSLVPLILLFGKKPGDASSSGNTVRSAIPAGIIAGCVLFLGASLQQIGLEDTSAGKAAFITGLYIVIVPVLGIFLKHRVQTGTWIGVAAAITGLYFLCITEGFSIAKGDKLELIGSLFWAVHILLIDYFVKRTDALKLSCIQFATCSVLSMAVALAFERITVNGLWQATIPILYGGICSVGIAYTLQVFGQKHAKPAHAAIILSLETAFASLGGWIILNENLGARGYLGCILMFAGMLISQLQGLRRGEG